MPKVWAKWLGATGWNVWLATRNHWNIVGVVVSRHTRGVNEVLAYAFDPTFVTRFSVRASLLLLVQYEMPEYPLVIVVRDDDTDTHTALKDLGLAAQEPTADHERWVFRHPPIVTFKPERTEPVQP